MNNIKLSLKEKKIFNFLKNVKYTLNLPVHFYICGGWVRDKLLGKNSDDIDISVDMPGFDLAKIIIEEAIKQNMTKDGKAYNVSLDKEAEPLSRSEDTN